MSRRSQDDEYSDNHKTIEKANIENYSEDEENYKEQEVEELRDENSYEYCNQICEITKILKKYTHDQTLPLCQYLSPGLMAEFIQGEEDRV